MNRISALKDEVLWNLSKDFNIAHFVSFDSALNIRYSTLENLPSNCEAQEALERLLQIASTVNIRTFTIEKPSGNPFVYEISNIDVVLQHLKHFSAQGLFCIVNETIPVADGGVSGVVDRGVVEFSPDDTPRAVEKADVCSLPLEVAQKILSIVYGLNNPVPYRDGERIEFSIHPKKVGVKQQRVLVWECNKSELETVPKISPIWTNTFSRHLGDKVFGLLIAQVYGLPVPFGTVVGRRIAPFAFGERTGTGEFWIRTCPIVQEPGKFTTTPVWVDPYRLISVEDPNHDRIQSLIFQEGIDARYSGATFSIESELLIEGVQGRGDKFMMGSEAPEPLPDNVISDITDLVQKTTLLLDNPVRIEWVHDGFKPWIVQLHVMSGEPHSDKSKDLTRIERWINYDPDSGLTKLEEIIGDLDRKTTGISITKFVGVTSHVGDLLRKNKIAYRYRVSKESI